MSYTFKRDYVNYGKNANGYYSMDPEGITFHNTSNNATAQNERDYCNSQCEKGSAAATYHYAIDDTTVIQLLPQNINGWHSGDGASGYGNRKTLGVEVCYTNPDIEGYSEEKYNKAMDNAFTEMAKICISFNWSVDKIGLHYDRSGKYCPMNTMNKNGGSADKTRTYIINEVQKKINEITTPVETKNPPQFNSRPELKDFSVSLVDEDNISLNIYCDTSYSNGSTVYFQNTEIEGAEGYYSTNKDLKGFSVEYNVNGKSIDLIFGAGKMPKGTYRVGVLIENEYGEVRNSITKTGDLGNDSLKLVESNEKIDIYINYLPEYKRKVVDVVVN